jgi:hypothetical protein
VTKIPEIKRQKYRMNKTKSAVCIRRVKMEADHTSLELENLGEGFRLKFKIFIFQPSNY